MADFHPSDNQLLEYSAGTCDWAVGLSIAAHLHYCPQCRARISELNQIGGFFLSEPVSQEISSNSFSKTLSKIRHVTEHSGDERKSHCASKYDFSHGMEDQHYKPNDGPSYPPVVKKLLQSTGKLHWRQVGFAVKASRLLTGQDKYEVNLHRIRKGGTVPEHDHQGLEITIVLEGSFSDENGVYHPGDFIAKLPGEKHRPTATQDNDCLCLSVSEAPIKLSGFWGRMITPFFKISPQ